MNLDQTKHETIFITKRGIPIAKLMAYEETPKDLFGFMRDSICILGNSIEPIDECWDAENI